MSYICPLLIIPLPKTKHKHDKKPITDDEKQPRKKKVPEAVWPRTHLLGYSVNNFRERDRRRVGDEED
jgi:hypothetical protein